MLELRGLQVQYGSIVAVRDLSLSVNEGELVALIGANGAGKTTTLATIAGVLKPRKGSIAFRGHSIAGLPPEAIVRKGIAMVPEDREVFPTLTIEENLRLGGFIRRNRAEYRRDVDEMCTLFPILGERLAQAAGTLSGGEQQQLALARALMSHPKLLMLDEPSLGLAPALVEKVFKLVTRLHRQGMTILLVEQNVHQTLDIVDRAYVLSIGRVEAAGTPADLRHQVNLQSVYLGEGPAGAPGHLP